MNRGGQDGSDDTDLEAALRKGRHIFDALRRCVENSGEPCEGNIFFTRGSWQAEPEMQGKQKNLFTLARGLTSNQHGPPRILEIGFNAGHSVCLMLLANPKVQVVAFDLCDHTYTKPCFEALRRHFGAERLELHAGSSTETLPAYRAANPDARFDLLHVDGGHQYLVAMADMENCRQLARRPPDRLGMVVLDDTDLTGIATVWTDCVAAGHVVEREAPHALGEFQHSIGDFVCDPPADGEATCGACAASGAPFSCGGCHAVRYCSQQCARSHWKRHRAVCASRQPPPLSFPSLEDCSPSQDLRAGPDGSLVAARDLDSGETLFCEPPLAWQPQRDLRLRFCAHCGAESGMMQRCPDCNSIVLCERCQGQSCRFCPELKITRSTVSAATLLLLDIVRRREARSLPSDALLPPVRGVRADHHGRARDVQRVGHFCSAVKWTDDSAAQVVAASEPGVTEAAAASGEAAGICYFRKFARLRIASLGQDVRQGNVVVQMRPSDEHYFTCHAVLTCAVSKGARVFLKVAARS